MDNIVQPYTVPFCLEVKKKRTEQYCSILDENCCICYNKVRQECTKNGRRLILLPETGVLLMSEYVTWNDLIQLITAFVGVATLIITFLTYINSNKK